MSAPVNPKRRSQIMLDDEQYKRLVEEAKLEDRSVSSIVREALADWLDARKPRPVEETPFWELVGAFASGQDGAKPISENVDYYLYDDYLAKKKTSIKSPKSESDERD